MGMHKKTNNLTFAADDRIFLGEGLFETLKVVSGQPLNADLHWQRLNEGARQVGISFTLSYEQWFTRLMHKIQYDGLSEGGIKAILSGGSAPRGLAMQGQSSHLVLQTFKFIAQIHPLRLISAPWVRDAANPLYRVKSINYLEAILARRQALATGVDDALFFNMQQHATETTCANLFLIYQHTLFTPPLTDGVLPGITRARILQLSREQQLNCREISVTRSMLQQADAVFITNSLQGIQVVCSLDDTIFAAEHALIRHLKSALS